MRGEKEFTGTLTGYDEFISTPLVLHFFASLAPSMLDLTPFSKRLGSQRCHRIVRTVDFKMLHVQAS